jgi:hypothetical protein
MKPLRDLFPELFMLFYNILHPIFNRKFFILFGVFLLIATVEFVTWYILIKLFPSYLPQQLTFLSNNDCHKRIALSVKV